MVIAITGKSGSGKSTLVNNFVEKHKDYHKIIPYTTRPKRPLEQDGIDYHFVSNDEITREDDLILRSIYNGWRYAIDKKDIFKESKKSIGVFTPADIRRLKQLGGKVVSVYIYSDDRTNVMRALERGDNIGEVFRRYLTDLGQFDGFVYESDICIGSPNRCMPQMLLSDLETELYKIKDYRDNE